MSYDHLPHDVIFDILSRLLVKTLVRCKSVCKTWHALIENPIFVKNHKEIQSSLGFEPTFSALFENTPWCWYRRVETKRVLYYSKASWEPIDLGLRYFSNAKHCVLVGACDGLVCLGLSLNESNIKISRIIICNPTTGQFRLIPYFNYREDKHIRVLLGSGSHVDDHVVVRIVYIRQWKGFEPVLVIRAKVYSMCGDTWRETKVKLGNSPYLGKLYLSKAEQGYPKKAVAVDGVFHWLAGRECIASFNISTEVFDATHAPPPLFTSKIYNPKLLKIKEELALVFTHYYHRRSEFWMLNKDMTWTMRFSYDYREIPGYWENLFDHIRVLETFRNGVLVLGNTYGKAKLFLINIDSKEVKFLQEVDVGYRLDDVFLYPEFLTPV